VSGVQVSIRGLDGLRMMSRQFYELVTDDAKRIRKEILLIGWGARCIWV